MAAARRALAPVPEDLLRSPAKFKAWLAANAVVVEDTRKETLRAVLSREDLADRVRDVINARLASAGIATPKLDERSRCAAPTAASATGSLTTPLIPVAGAVAVSNRTTFLAESC